MEKDFKKNPDNFRTKLIATFDTVKEARDFELKQTKKIYKILARYGGRDLIGKKNEISSNMFWSNN